MQYNSLLTKLQSMFVSKEAYILNGDDLWAPGRLSCLHVSLVGGEWVSEPPYREAVDVEGLPVISEGTLVGEVMRYILMRLRAALKVAPYADAHMLSVLRGKLNEGLKAYNMFIADTDEPVPVVKFMYMGNECDTEMLIRILAAAEARDTGGQSEFDLAYAKRLMGLMRYEEALKLFTDELKQQDPSSMFYTELCMYIGEIYYHMDNRRLSAEYYMMCDMRYVTDVNDYYSRLGHALCDDGSGLRGELVKMYYRCRLNPNYKKSVADKYERLKEQVEPIYEEYERHCIETGMRQKVTG